MPIRSKDLPPELRKRLKLADKPRIRQPRRGVMNGLEKKYAAQLEAERLVGLVQWYGFEAMTLRLPGGVRYTPDFVVVDENGLTFREVKGHRRDGGIVRLKVAAGSFPAFQFWLVEYVQARWRVTEVMGDIQ